MIYQLKKEDYNKVLPLCQDLDYHLTMLAVIDTRSPGRIYVDDIQKPQSAFICSVEGFYLAGNSENTEFNQALSALIHDTSESEKSVRVEEEALYLDICPQSWEDHLSTLFPKYKPLKELRRKYLCTDLCGDWKNLLSEGFSVHPVDKYLFDKMSWNIPEHLHLWILTNWGTMEYFFQHGFGFCVVHNQQVVSWSIADCIKGDRCEIGIHTLPEYRRRGLATITVGAAVDFCFSQGYKSVGWHCDDSNVGSWKTAEKLGFKKKQDYMFYLYLFDEADHLAEMGWRYVQTKHYHKAVSAFQQVFALKEDVPSYWHHSAAIAYAGAGDFDKALLYLRKVVEKKWPHPHYTEHCKEFTALHKTPDWLWILSKMRQA